MSQFRCRRFPVVNSRPPLTQTRKRYFERTGQLLTITGVHDDRINIRPSFKMVRKPEQFYGAATFDDTVPEDDVDTVAEAPIPDEDDAGSADGSLYGGDDFVAVEGMGEEREEVGADLDDDATVAFATAVKGLKGKPILTSTPSRFVDGMQLLYNFGKGVGWQRGAIQRIWGVTAGGQQLPVGATVPAGGAPPHAVVKMQFEDGDSADVDLDPELYVPNAGVGGDLLGGTDAMGMGRWLAAM